MTLVWHSWFTTSIEASTQGLMLAQNSMMRSHALGNFHALLLDVTRDPAMLLRLNGNENTRESPNENYGRELMELFTLGADRGAYNQRDVHQQARALTGFTNDWSDSAGAHNFRFDSQLHDPGIKTIFGQRGRFDWRDSCRLCLSHPLHASFMVRKLWSLWPSRGTIPRGEIEVQLTNRGEDAHDLRLRRLGAGGHLVGHTLGVQVTGAGELSAARWHLGPGRFELYCSLPGHRRRGMHTVLVVK
jgi:hypothetical protein